MYVLFFKKIRWMNVNLIICEMEKILRNYLTITRPLLIHLELGD